MARRARRTHNPAFKAKVALAAIKRRRPGVRRRWPNWRSSMTFIPTRSRPALLTPRDIVEMLQENSAAQAGRQGRAGCPDQPAPRTQARHHRLPLPHSAKGSALVIGQRRQRDMPDGRSAKRSPEPGSARLVTTS